MKSKKIAVGLLVIVVFAGFAVYSFRTALNPYVTFAEAAEAAGTVQVMGYLDGEPVYDRETLELRFYLKDEAGTRALVAYAGAAPANLEHAESMVVVGRFEGEVFRAERLLVKCPSKYEEEGES